MKAASLVTTSIQHPITYFGVHQNGLAFALVAAAFFMMLNVIFIREHWLTLFGGMGIFIALCGWFQALGRRDQHWQTLMILRRKHMRGRPSRALRAGVWRG